MSINPFVSSCNNNIVILLTSVAELLSDARQPWPVSSKEVSTCGNASVVTMLVNMQQTYWRENASDVVDADLFSLKSNRSMFYIVVIFPLLRMTTYEVYSVLLRLPAPIQNCSRHSCVEWTVILMCFWAALHYVAHWHVSGVSAVYAHAVILFVRLTFCLPEFEKRGESLI